MLSSHFTVNSNFHLPSLGSFESNPLNLARCFFSQNTYFDRNFGSGKWIFSTEISLFLQGTKSGGWVLNFSFPILTKKINRRNLAQIQSPEFFGGEAGGADSVRNDHLSENCTKHSADFNSVRQFCFFWTTKNEVRKYRKAKLQKMRGGFELPPTDCKHHSSSR